MTVIAILSKDHGTRKYRCIINSRTKAHNDNTSKKWIETMREELWRYKLEIVISKRNCYVIDEQHSSPKQAFVLCQKEYQQDKIISIAFWTREKGGTLTIIVLYAICEPEGFFYAETGVGRQGNKGSTESDGIGEETIW